MNESIILLLKSTCTPEENVELGAEGVNQIWRDVKLRAVGMKKVITLCETVEKSAATYEMKNIGEEIMNKSKLKKAMYFALIWGGNACYFYTFVQNHGSASWITC